MLIIQQIIIHLADQMVVWTMLIVSILLGILAILMNKIHLDNPMGPNIQIIMAIILEMICLVHMGLGNMVVVENNLVRMPRVKHPTLLRRQIIVK